ncbi:SPW repeat domain-containing protein [Nocardiopsis suaedae]|uniref:SPW repeat protein n=1 Tax=Nocardiopsis suaedae TaxID=3018444 RepID=A0ABT4TX22_9ACTN|nr:SPW repeat protein [Nocardiopsis suaedae]MDA2808677.1 SPW repeat protein [Nocardiopsis suaedae]
MENKGRAADWVAVATGVLLSVSWIWDAMIGPPRAAMFILGLLIVLAATMAITRPGLMASEAFIFALGALVFVLPWLMAFTANPAAAWTSWILGVVAMAAGVVGSLQTAGMTHRHGPVPH